MYAPLYVGLATTSRAADRTLAIGAGQMSRVDAVNVARMKVDAAAPTINSITPPAAGTYFSGQVLEFSGMARCHNQWRERAPSDFVGISL